MAATEKFLLQQKVAELQIEISSVNLSLAETVPRSQFRIYLQVLKSVCILSANLRSCVEAPDVGMLMSFLDELSRYCYQGADILDSDDRKLVLDQVATITKNYKEIAMLWMKNNLSPDKDYDWNELAEVLYCVQVSFRFYSFSPLGSGKR